MRFRRKETRAAWFDARIEYHGPDLDHVTNIAIWRYGGFGDNILAAPLIGALHDRFPGVPVHFYGHHFACQVLDRAGLVASTYPLYYEWDRWVPPLDTAGSRWGELPSVQRQLQDILRHADVVLAFNLNTAYSRTALERLAVPNRAVGGTLPPVGVHQASYMLEAASFLGVDTSWTPWHGFRLDIDQPAPDIGVDPKRMVLIAPGAHGRALYKAWPIERFLMVAAALRNEGVEPVIVLGPFERDWLTDHDDLITIVRCPDILDLAALMREARLYIGNDSGMTHLAAMMGCPTLALFGPTHPASWRPIGPNATTIRACQNGPDDLVIRLGKWRGDGVRVCTDTRCMYGLDWKTVVDYAGDML